MPRMNILNASEQEQFDTPPVFTSVQRKQFFDFPNGILEQADTLRFDRNKLNLLVAYGYFKASKRFFLPQHYHDRDIEYVASRINISAQCFNPSQYPARTRRNHQKMVLDFCGFRPFDQNAEKCIDQEIYSMVRSHLKPKLIFWRCVDILTRDRIQIPGYFRISDLVTSAVNTHQSFGGI